MQKFEICFKFFAEQVAEENAKAVVISISIQSKTSKAAHISAKPCKFALRFEVYEVVFVEKNMLF